MKKLLLLVGVLTISIACEKVQNLDLDREQNVEKKSQAFNVDSKVAEGEGLFNQFYDFANSQVDGDVESTDFAIQVLLNAFCFNSEEQAASNRSFSRFIEIDLDVKSLPTSSKVSDIYRYTSGVFINKVKSMLQLEKGERVSFVSFQRTNSYAKIEISLDKIDQDIESTQKLDHTAPYLNLLYSKPIPNGYYNIGPSGNYACLGQGGADDANRLPAELDVYRRIMSWWKPLLSDACPGRFLPILTFNQTIGGDSPEYYAAYINNDLPMSPMPTDGLVTHCHASSLRTQMVDYLKLEIQRRGMKFELHDGVYDRNISCSWIDMEDVRTLDPDDEAMALKFNVSARVRICIPTDLIPCPNCI